MDASRVRLRCSLVLLAGVVGMGTAPPAQGTFVIDASFTDAGHGWALLASPCATGPAPWCHPTLAATSDGGLRWRRLALPRGAARVSAVVRVDAGLGFLLGDRTFVTRDAGATWRALDALGVESLTARPVYALTYRHLGCPAACLDGLIRYLTRTGRVVRVKSFRNPSRGFGDQVLAVGARVYVVSYGHTAGGAGRAYAHLAVSPNGGRTWTLRGDPCARPDGAEVDTVAAAAAGPYVAALCQPRFGGHASLAVSADGGRSFRWRAEPVGDANQLAVDAHGTLAVANGHISGNGPYRYRLALSRDAGATWRVTFDRRGAVRPIDGHASLFVSGSAVRWVAGSATLWASDDAGARWREVTPR